MSIWCDSKLNLNWVVEEAFLEMLNESLPNLIGIYTYEAQLPDDRLTIHFIK
jgi:hypothetical protein